MFEGYRRWNAKRIGFTGVMSLVLLLGGAYLLTTPQNIVPGYNDAGLALFCWVSALLLHQEKTLQLQREILVELENQSQGDA